MRLDLSKIRLNKIRDTHFKKLTFMEVKLLAKANFCGSVIWLIYYTTTISIQFISVKIQGVYTPRFGFLTKCKILFGTLLGESKMCLLVIKI